MVAASEARDNVHLIQQWTAGLDLDAIKADRKTRYPIERAFIAIDAAIRDIPHAARNSREDDRWLPQRARSHL